MIRFFLTTAALLVFAFPSYGVCQDIDWKAEMAKLLIKGHLGCTHPTYIEGSMDICGGITISSSFERVIDQWAIYTVYRMSPHRVIRKVAVDEMARMVWIDRDECHEVPGSNGHQFCNLISLDHLGSSVDEMQMGELVANVFEFAIPYVSPASVDVMQVIPASDELYPVGTIVVQVEKYDHRARTYEFENRSYEYRIVENALVQFRRTE